MQSPSHFLATGFSFVAEMQTSLRHKLEGESIEEFAFSSNQQSSYGVVDEDAKRLLGISNRQGFLSEFQRILQPFDMSKVMVLDSSLRAPLDRVVSRSDLKAMGIKFSYDLQSVNLTHKYHDYIYLFRSSLENTQALIEHFRLNKQPCTNLGKSHSIYLLPSASLCLEDEFKRNGLINIIAHIGKFTANTFPLAEGLLSLELPSFPPYETELPNFSPLKDCAFAISELEAAYGEIPHVHAYGNQALKVVELLRRSTSYAQWPSLHVKNEYVSKLKGLLAERIPADPLKITPPLHFSRLIVVDRSNDLITPCLTPSTYEGLIDEFLNISNNCVKFEGKEIHLEDTHPLYKRLKNAHICDVQNIIQNELQCLKVFELRIKGMQDVMKNGSLPEGIGTEHANLLNEYVTRKEWCEIQLRLAKYVTSEFNTATYQLLFMQERNILDQTDQRKSFEFIDELIAAYQPVQRVLKLLCLYSQVYGLSSDEGDALYHAVIQTYGYSYLFTLQSLEAAGFLVKSKPIRLHKKVCTLEGFDISQPRTIAYAYSGFVPLNIQYIASVISNRPNPSNEGLELVCFVGGCTRAESSACRILSDKIVMFTSHILTPMASSPSA